MVISQSWVHLQKTSSHAFTRHLLLFSVTGEAGLGYKASAALSTTESCINWNKANVCPPHQPIETRYHRLHSRHNMQESLFFCVHFSVVWSILYCRVRFIQSWRADGVFSLQKTVSIFSGWPYKLVASLFFLVCLLCLDVRKWPWVHWVCLKKTVCNK